MNEKFYAEVIVDNKSTNTDRLYTYLIPKFYINKIEPGMRVLVPFGFGNKLLEGLVLSIKNNLDINEKLLKTIDTLIDDKPIISSKMLELGIWMKEEYLAQYLDVYRTILPSGTTVKVKKYIKLVKSLDTIGINPNKSRNLHRILEMLRNYKELELKEIKVKLKISNISKYIDVLLDEGIIEIYDKLYSETNKKYEKYVVKNFDDKDLNKIIVDIGKRAFKQGEIIRYIGAHNKAKLRDVVNELNTTTSTVNILEEKGFIKIIDVELKRSPITREISEYKKVKLTTEQQQCLDSICKNISEGHREFLIHGVTGSGKTEVYLQLIEKVIEENRQAIVLVPEISLTPQTVERFVGRFGDNVAVLHSRLSLGERYDEWRRIKEGEVDIVVGARSAIFAPFDRLGLIIIDEEHESSYKSSMNPKYSAIEIAEKRCEIENCALVLGSATPSIETFYRCRSKEIIMLSLPNRVNNKSLPPIEIIDMKKELELGNKSIFSRNLYVAIEENLNKKKQTILFLNRRGFSTFVSCRKCGYVVKCNECDIALTYHISENILKCHYCGLAIKPPQKCPDCESTYIKYFGIGTQKIEDMVKKYFPSARVARMDVDTTSKKGSHERILSKVKNGEVDILIGTQMITKGLDFPNVTLVGIIAADLSLNLPDFKASERTFQLLTQVGGRAGRGEADGKVILQTYEPDHYSIIFSKDHDYISFYEKEILLRKEFKYPPYTNIINIVVSEKNEDNVLRTIKDIYEKLICYFDKENLQDLILSAPNQSPVPKVKGNFRWHILMRIDDNNLKTVKNIIKRVCVLNKDKVSINDCKINIDINPSSIV